MRDRDKGFRGQFLGGFNRRDVLDYIEELSAERNSLAAENEKLRNRVDALEMQAWGCYSITPERPAPEKARDNGAETAKKKSRR